MSKWQYEYFDASSWRFFDSKEFDNTHDNLFILYVLNPDSGYKGDVFIFPIKDFRKLLKEAVKSGQKVKLCMTRLKEKPTKWKLMKTTNKKNFNKGPNDQNTIDISKYYRNFGLLD